MKSKMFRALLWLWGRLPIPKPLRWAMMWLGVQKFLVGVSALVINERGEVLLFKHTYRQNYAWGLPAGWLQNGEDPARAVEREVYEESGMRVKVVRPLHAGVVRPYPQIDMIFLAQHVSGTFRPSAEVSEGRFFPCDALPALYPESRALIQKLVGEIVV